MSQCECKEVIVTARHLRVRGGQPGFAVIETTDRAQRLSFLFSADEAVDFAEELLLYAAGAEKAKP